MFCFFNSDADEKAEVGTTPSVRPVLLRKNLGSGCRPGAASARLLQLRASLRPRESRDHRCRWRQRCLRSRSGSESGDSAGGEGGNRAMEERGRSRGSTRPSQHCASLSLGTGSLKPRSPCPCSLAFEQAWNQKHKVQAQRK